MATTKKRKKGFSRKKPPRKRTVAQNLRSINLQRENTGPKLRTKDPITGLVSAPRKISLTNAPPAKPKKKKRKVSTALDRVDQEKKLGFRKQKKK